MLCRELAAADAWCGCCKQYSKKFKTGSENKTQTFNYMQYGRSFNIKAPLYEMK
jgi:hypothetical protein